MRQFLPLRTPTCVLVIVVCVDTVALAADGNTVSIGWGDMVATLAGGLQQALGILLLAAATTVVGMLPAWVQDIVKPIVNTIRVNQLFEKAAATVIGGTAGAVRGRTVEVNIANGMVRDLVKLALERGSPMVLDFAGRSIDSLAEKALARLQEQGVIPQDYTLSHARTAAAEGMRTAQPS